jgi:hypothetical protein
MVFHTGRMMTQKTVNIRRFIDFLGIVLTLNSNYGKESRKKEKRTSTDCSYCFFSAPYPHIDSFWRQTLYLTGSSAFAPGRSGPNSNYTKVVFGD